MPVCVEVVCPRRAQKRGAIRSICARDHPEPSRQWLIEDPPRHPDHGIAVTLPRVEPMTKAHAQLLVRSISALLGLFGAACGRSSATAPADGGIVATGPRQQGSCDRSAIDGTCSDYDAAYLEQNRTLLVQSCGKLGGAFVGDACPNTSIVGTCTLSTGEARSFYATGPSAYDPARARAACTTTFHGTWSGR